MLRIFVPILVLSVLTSGLCFVQRSDRVQVPVYLLKWIKSRFEAQC